MTVEMLPTQIHIHYGCPDCEPDHTILYACDNNGMNVRLYLDPDIAKKLYVDTNKIIGKWVSKDKDD